MKSTKTQSGKGAQALPLVGNKRVRKWQNTTLISYNYSPKRARSYPVPPEWNRTTTNTFKAPTASQHYSTRSSLLSSFLLFSNRLIFNHVYCVCGGTCTLNSSALRDQRLWIFLEMELQVCVSHTMWTLPTELQSSP